MPDKKLKVLFLCTGNSCRSQMAEGWANALHGDVIEAYSAGVRADGLNPRAVVVMAEAGIDINAHESKKVEAYLTDGIDLVITVCSQAHDTCPAFPGSAQVIHNGFEDPPYLTRGMVDEESILEIYRRVRDEIQAYVLSLPEVLGTALGQEQSDE